MVPVLRELLMLFSLFSASRDESCLFAAAGNASLPGLG